MNKRGLSIIFAISVAVFIIGSAFGIGWWPGNGGDLANGGYYYYVNNPYWKNLWTKQLSLILQKDVYDDENENVKIGKIIVGFYPTKYKGGVNDNAELYFLLDVFVIYYAGSYYENQTPAQGEVGEAYYVKGIDASMKIISNKQNRNIDFKFWNAGHSYRYGHWVSKDDGDNNYYDDWYFVMDGEFYTDNSREIWHQKLLQAIERLQDENARKEAFQTWSTVAGGISFGLDVITVLGGISCPPVGIALGASSLALTAASYYTNCNDFDVYLRKGDWKRGDTEINSYEATAHWAFAPSDINHNDNFFWWHDHWPVIVHTWTHGVINVYEWGSENFEKFELSLSVTFGKISVNDGREDYIITLEKPIPIYMNKSYGGSVPISVDIPVDTGMIHKEILSPPTISFDNENGEHYAGEPQRLNIELPGRYYNVYINWGDGNDEIIYEHPSLYLYKSHIWTSPGTYTVRVFYFKEGYKHTDVLYQEDEPYASSWTLTYYYNTMLSAMEIKSIDIYSGNGDGGGDGDDGEGGSSESGGAVGCPFLFTYQDNSYVPVNNVLVWAENSTRGYLNTVDYYLLDNIEAENGIVRLGIGEMGNDVDYIDYVGLYYAKIPRGCEVSEDFSGNIYAYRNPIDCYNGFWVGDSGEYLDVNIDISQKGNLLILKTVDNPPNVTESTEIKWKPPAITMSTIWLYAKLGDEWIKIAEIKTRHNLHTNVINLDALLSQIRYGYENDNITLRFMMKDRNGIAYVGISHDFYEITNVHRARPIIENDEGYETLYADNHYAILHPYDFIPIAFKVPKNENYVYLVSVVGFYMNKNQSANEGILIFNSKTTNIAESQPLSQVYTNQSVVLFPMLPTYDGYMFILWFINDSETFMEMPTVMFKAPGKYFVKLYVGYSDGKVLKYTVIVNVV